MVTHTATIGSIQRIGPNTVIQTVSALHEQLGVTATHALLERSGLIGLADFHADQLIDEQLFVVLHASLVRTLRPEVLAQIDRRAGQLTAEYVLENRIPKPVHWLLKRLPSVLALRILLLAIQQHAWTFTGSGQFATTFRPTPQMTLSNSITARQRHTPTPVCFFYQAAFQHLLQTLVRGQVQVTETTCIACGDPCCSFRIEVNR
jgi:divinyl protochlorophyllide a 8-vinyl-reductase